jgi:hypothetical protein
MSKSNLTQWHTYQKLQNHNLHPKKIHVEWWLEHEMTFYIHDPTQLRHHDFSFAHSFLIWNNLELVWSTLSPSTALCPPLPNWTTDHHFATWQHYISFPIKFDHWSPLCYMEPLYYKHKRSNEYGLRPTGLANEKVGTKKHHAIPFNTEVL